MTFAEFLPKLSQNYIELLENEEFYDTTIEVGKDSNEKIFRAHMSILYYRSPYLQRALASNKQNNDGVVAQIKLPDISPETFEIILKYIYGAILPLNDRDTSVLLQVLVAAHELLIQELVDYLQKYLIEKKSEWLEQHFDLVHRTSFKHSNLLELQKFCIDFMLKTPEKIFNSLDFTSLPEQSLVELIKSDDLKMKEIDIWEHVLKWGLAKNPTILPDSNNWTEDDYEAMENTLQRCLPLIRFFSLSSKEFKRVHPYRDLLSLQLYEDLLNSYLDADTEPLTNNILPPRNVGTIDSKIVNSKIVSMISRWIDKVEMSGKFTHLRELYLPYKYELLLRGSRDGFTPKSFHTLCDNKPMTVVFIKVKGTDEILGGYNPLKWESSQPSRNSSNTSCKTKNSFIFSFKNKDDIFKDAIISNVENPDNAIAYSIRYGPYFGNDLTLASSASELSDYNRICCQKTYYEKNIRDTEEKFSIEDYEVFQIIKK